MTRPRPQSAAEARAEVEAARSQRSAARRQVLDAAFGDSLPGKPIRVLSWAATVALVVISLAAMIDPDRFLAGFLVITIVLFLLGVGLLALDLVLAAARSRTHLLGVAALFFLGGVAPRAVQVSLNVSLGVAVAVSIVCAVTRPSVPELAFGTLTPLFQLGLSGLWGVRHGHFETRLPASGSVRGGAGR